MCIVSCIAYIHYRFIVEHDNTNIEKYIYKRWMLMLSFGNSPTLSLTLLTHSLMKSIGIPLLAFLPMTTSSYEYDAFYCSTFIPFCTFRMTKWGVRWITFLYYVVEFILVLCTHSLMFTHSLAHAYSPTRSCLLTHSLAN